MFKVFVLFVCFHFSASQYLYFNRGNFGPAKMEPKHLYFNRGSLAGPTKMELPTRDNNNVDSLLQKNYECKTIYLPTMKFFEGKSSQKCIFPFILNGEVYNKCINIDAATGSALTNGT